jgi:dTDP-4-amino-4,6-dideoxygalactose transaminase
MSLPNRSITPVAPCSKAFEWRVPLVKLGYSDVEEQALLETFRSGWWTYGPVTRELEKRFAQYLGVRHALAVSSGTAALHLACVALGAGEGGETITPSLTFVAAANTILHSGGYPRFADVQALNNPVLSVETIERVVTARTRGVCVMHYGGYACAMDEIMEFARRRGLWVIEDAAHAPGAAWAGIRCGAWGDVGCFSFFGNKNMTCGEGGMVVTGRDDIAERLRVLRSHGMSSLTWDRFQGHQFSYDVTEAGFNYRMDDLRAAVLGGQLRSLEHRNLLRRERVRWYCERLGGDSRWIIPFEKHGGKSACHLFVVVLDAGISREDVMAKMKRRRIQTSIHYPPVHLFSFFRKVLPDSADLKITEDIGRRLVTLPLYPEMTREDVDLVCSALRESAQP